jgi:hypothetical protein
MPKGPFLPSEFVPTKFSTAADKADFSNAFLHFIESEWKETLFTKTFCNRLSNTFGHIAHYVENAIMRRSVAQAPLHRGFREFPLRIIPFSERDWEGRESERTNQSSSMKLTEIALNQP